MEQTLFQRVAGPCLGHCDDPALWSKITGRQALQLRIYQVRDPDSNPYYPKNGILRRCIAALEEIIAQSGPKACQGKDLELMQNICAAIAPGTDTLEDMAAQLQASEDPLCREFSYYATHDLVVIDRIAGGHRSPISNDTEIDLHVYLLAQTDPAAVEAFAAEACRRHGVLLQILHQQKGGTNDV